MTNLYIQRPVCPVLKWLLPLKLLKILLVTLPRLAVECRKSGLLLRWALSVHREQEAQRAPLTFYFVLF